MNSNKNNSEHKTNEEKQLRYFLIDLLDCKKTELEKKQKELSHEVTKNLNLGRLFNEKSQENILLKETKKNVEIKSSEITESFSLLEKEKQRAKILTPEVKKTERIHHDLALPFMGYSGIIEKLEQKDNFQFSDIQNFIKLNDDFKILNNEINKIISLNQNYSKFEDKNNER